MNRGRLSAAEKGKQKAADDADLPPAALVPESEGEPRPAGDAAQAANWHAGGAGLPRHILLLPPSGTPEIEEAPPSPPPAPSSRLPALNPEDAAALVAGLDGQMKKLQAALRQIEQLHLESDGADEPEVAGAEAPQLLQHQLRTVQEKMSGMSTKDKMLALRFQADEMQAWEEFWKPVVVPPVPQRSSSNNKGKAKEEMEAYLKEFWKPVPVPERNNSKIKWKQILKFWSLSSLILAVKGLGHASRTITISRHVPRLIYVCFWLLVLYVLYLILRPCMVLLLVCLANISRDSDGSTCGTSS